MHTHFSYIHNISMNRLRIRFCFFFYYLSLYFQIARTIHFYFSIQKTLNYYNSFQITLQNHIFSIHLPHLFLIIFSQCWSLWRQFHVSIHFNILNFFFAVVVSFAVQSFTTGLFRLMSHTTNAKFTAFYLEDIFYMLILYVFLMQWEISLPYYNIILQITHQLSFPQKVNTTQSRLVSCNFVMWRLIC